MKPRKVILTLEVETDAPLRELRRVRSVSLYAPAPGWETEWDLLGEADVIQAQANVVKDGER